VRRLWRPPARTGASVGLLEIVGDEVGEAFHRRRNVPVAVGDHYHVPGGGSVIDVHHGNLGLRVVFQDPPGQDGDAHILLDQLHHQVPLGQLQQDPRLEVRIEAAGHDVPVQGVFVVQGDKVLVLERSVTDGFALGVPMASMQDQHVFVLHDGGHPKGVGNDRCYGKSYIQLIIVHVVLNAVGAPLVHPESDARILFIESRQHARQHASADDGRDPQVDGAPGVLF